MGCRYTYKGKTYEAHEFDDVLRAMSPSEAAAFMPGVKSIPSAPLIGKTESWTALALKRVLRMAVDGGYDKVAFITGEQSAARYDLSKQVDRIDYFKRDDGRYDIEVRKVGERDMLPISDPLTPEKLADTVGKEIAEKIVADAGEPASQGWKRIAGLDLKVGGEGMRTFYDKIVPNVLKDVLKKVGGGKVEAITLSTPEVSDKNRRMGVQPNWSTARVVQRGDVYQVWARNQNGADQLQGEGNFDSAEAAQAFIDNAKAAFNVATQPAITITDEMRDAVSAGLPLFSRKEQAEGRSVPESVDAVANVEAAFRFAATQSFPTNRDFKIAMQEQVNAAAKAAKVDLSEFSKGTEEYLVRMVIADGRTALRTNANAVGWYNEKVTKALKLVSLIHPEVESDPKAKFAFVWGMAVTSNGLKVDKNFELAETVYRGFKNAGKMPTNVGIGTAAAAINRSLGLYNTLVARDGIDRVIDFMTNLQTAKQVEQVTGQKVSGENLTTQVYGAASLGPKIGNGFFMNLYGRFEQLTMDRWLMRTWGRWTGTLVNVNAGQVKAKRDQMKALIRQLSPEDKKAFGAIIKRKLSLSDPDGVAMAIQKASMKPEARIAMAKLAPAEASAINAVIGEPSKGIERVSFGDEMRKAGNALAKYLDGQKEAPAGPPERGNIRKVFNRALVELQKDHPTLTMADLQALLWYPEKRLYDAAKTADEATDGYEDDEAPDYANAAAKLARAQGIPEDRIAAAIAEVDAQLAADGRAAGVRSGERGPGDREAGPQFSLKAPDTPEFRRWFGESKVVDADGQPLVMYHGSNRDISQFRAPIARDGVYFSSDADYAAGYGEVKAGVAGGAPAVYPVYLSIRNPLTLDGEDGASWERYTRRGFDVRDLARQGYDGVLMKYADGEVEAMIFRPDQAKSAIGNSGAFGRANPRIQFSAKNLAGQTVAAGWQIPAPTKADDFLYSLQNKHIDTRRAVEAVKAAGKQIANQWNPYLQEELYHGRTAKQTKDFLKTEVEPLLEAMLQADVKLSEFEEYLHNRHAEERNDQIAKVNPSMPDAGSGIATADARAYLAGLPAAKRQKFDALAKRLDAITAGTRALLVSSGLEKQDTVSAWEATYQHYVPLQREDDGGTTRGTGAGFSVRGPSGKRAMGSDRPVIDILSNVVMQRERAITRAEKNRVSQALYGLALKAPNPNFWLPVNPAAWADKQGRVDPKTVAELVAMGLNPVDADSLVREPKQRYIDPATGLVAERINPALRSRDNVLALRVDGEDRFVFFSEKDPRAARMAGALKNLDADQLGSVLGTMAKITRWMAAVNTQYNPVFGIYNFMRDAGATPFNLTSTPLKDDKAAVMANILPALAGVYSDLRSQRRGAGPGAGQWAQLWEEYQKEGGQTGFRDMFDTSDKRTKDLERALNRLSEGTLKAAPRAVFDWLTDYNDAIENSVRLAVYKVARDKGLSKQEAASIGKNITVNFNRKGQVAQQAGAMYAFFNASVQGSARLYETLTGPAGKKIMAGGILLGVMQAVLLEAAGFGDDEPPEGTREKSIIIPLPDKKYLAVPMPLGLHVLPGVGRILTEWVLDGGRDPHKRLASLASLFVSAFNPIGTSGVSIQTIAPTPIDPAVALMENRDNFGRRIAKLDRSELQPTPGYTRAKDTASAVSKSASYWLGILSGGTDFKPGLINATPDQIDYLIGQATGGVGREALKVDQVISSWITGEELPPHKIPLIGRLYGDARSQASQANRFYENVKRLNEHEAELKGRRETKQSVADYEARNPEAKLVALGNAAEQQMSILRKQKDAMIKAGNKAKVKEIEAKMTETMRRVNEAVDRARK